MSSKVLNTAANVATGGLLQLGQSALGAITPTAQPGALPPVPVYGDQMANKLTDDALAAMQRGRSSTVLTGGQGLTNMGQTSKVLLGS